VREPGIEQLGDALAKGDCGKADTVLGRVELTDDAEVIRRRPDSLLPPAQS